jgi:uncharacterized protein (TIGR02145 family)
MTKYFILMTALVSALTFKSCRVGDSNAGSVYNEISIGTQIWMTKNLEVSSFRNGDPIPQVKTNEEWKAAGVNKQPAWCYNDNDPSNGTKYGKLYNWYAVNDPRGLAPTGWHIPNNEEWNTLNKYLGGETAEQDAGKKMKSTSGWIENGNGSNKSNFNGLPGGARNWNSGAFGGIGGYSIWWSSTEFNADDAWFCSVQFSGDNLFRFGASKMNGFYVRCLRN